MASSARTVAPLLLSPSQALSIPSESRVFLDATWFMPNVPRNPKQEFEGIRLPDARFLDIDQVATHTEEGAALGLKHMMPSPETFARACATTTEDLRIKPSTHRGTRSLPDMIPMAYSLPHGLCSCLEQAFSHTNSSVLDGGLPLWVNEGHEIETSSPKITTIEETLYAVPKLNESVIRSYAQMVNNSKLSRSDSATDLVVDARPHGRYLGTDPEPRPGMSSGHIPHSFSLPFNHFVSRHQFTNNTFLNSNPDIPFNSFTTLRSAEEITKELKNAVGHNFARQILSGEKGLVATCGSGMTAAILWLGISRIWEAEGKTLPTIRLYDESWTGYASRKESEISKGVETS
ncbi:hypothetical protein Clacol_003053 [Clathrus columnatus]|uniref:Rhodanese domain-containing protein n=1 Tax=Clathrus columnatus TaxID=1419009 RepID=A0AAV5A2F5_9AGAM|nr:hypothetical protein Clacol_003053 [Clathrus columnatus]